MHDDTLINFIESLYEDVSKAMDDANEVPIDSQYRVGVRKLAKAFFDKFELFEIRNILPDLAERDVDAWYAGRERKLQ